jgi:hypothetical protein
VPEHAEPTLQDERVERSTGCVEFGQSFQERTASSNTAASTDRRFFTSTD